VNPASGAPGGVAARSIVHLLLQTVAAAGREFHAAMNGPGDGVFLRGLATAKKFATRETSPTPDSRAFDPAGIVGTLKRAMDNRQIHLHAETVAEVEAANTWEIELSRY